MSEKSKPFTAIEVGTALHKAMVYDKSPRPWQTGRYLQEPLKPLCIAPVRHAMTGGAMALNESNGPKKKPFTALEVGTAMHKALEIRSQEEMDAAFGKGYMTFPEALADVVLKPHPIVKLGAELAAEWTPAEREAQRDLRFLAQRWRTKLRPPLLVANRLRQSGALWRLKGVGAC